MPASLDEMSCGMADGVFSTTDFGIEVGETRLASVWAQLRATQPTGPLVNSEFYPGAEIIFSTTSGYFPS